MRLCIFSDVHANLPALETLIERTKGCVDGYVCLGDSVNYGPWNDECLEVIHALPNVSVIEGNHERLFAGPDPVTREHSLVQEFFATSSRWFTRRDLITGLAQEHTLGSFQCLHTIDDRRIYANTAIDVAGNFIIGHTHHQFRLVRPLGTIINCGSVGQNRRRGDMIAFAIWSADEDAVSLHQWPYPVERFIRELSIRRYPDRCVQYYRELLNRAQA
jgi:predicted phosphodiesterase